ncbi:hypothetical protein BHM03_00002243 [Ensete ventricosum]|nr:hypothetical protein BHM03_00002243 [Ensete ventricosum]
MGCTGSKELRRDSGRSPSPYVRSHSLPIRAAGGRSGDGHNAVALSSTTLGSLVLDRGDLSSDDETMVKSATNLHMATAVIAKELGRARTWSEISDRRIPKTPTMTPPDDPEVINAWELMAGLEDASPLHLPPLAAPDRSSSSHTSHDSRRSPPDSELSSGSSSPKPQWMQLSPGDSVVYDFDPEILSSFREALDELSPQRQSYSIHQPLKPHNVEEEEEEEEEEMQKPSHARTQTVEEPAKGPPYQSHSIPQPPESEDEEEEEEEDEPYYARTRTVEHSERPHHQSNSICQPSEPEEEEEEEEKKKKLSQPRTGTAESVDSREVPTHTSIVRARINEFQRKIDARKTSINANSAKVAPSYKCPPGGEGKVVLYFTSLRGIRKTFEDCWAVSMILKGYGVRVDERDVSMHAGFKEELIDMLGPGYGGNRLPRIFADGNYLGGAEEVRHLHEAARLGKLLECCETMPSRGKGGSVMSACEGCGDVRFVPCETCSGSCKVFVEEQDYDVGGFRRCSDCNENGLVRCPLCC